MQIGYYSRIYILLVVQYLKTRMEYRADFCISLIGMFFMQITGLFSIWILFQSINQINDWNAYEILFVFGFAQLVIVPQQVCFDNLWSLGTKLRDGSFIKYYMRPLNPLFYYASEVFDIKGIGQILIGGITVYYANAHLDIHWDMATIAFLFLAYISSALIVIAMMLISASTIFWTLSQAVMVFTERLKGYSFYPMTIFQPSIKFLFTYIIPIGFLAFYPMQMLLKPEQMHFPVIVLPLVSLAFISVAYWLWQTGLKRYEGTGS